MRWRALVAVVGVALLAGCAVIHKPAEQQAGIADGSAWQAHRAALADFSSWSLQGRVATGQLLGWTGNLSWRERGPRFDVRLAGPLGAGGMRAQGTLDQVTIDTDDGKHFVTRDPDALVERTLGWSFPLAPLRYWARGLPAPGAYDRISVGENGRLQSITQDGWTVSYLDYTRPAGAPAELPRRVVLDNGDTRIRLVVDRWFDLGSSS
ncbi:lipoprotein insertase outer membrane protein LolB [Salinisphaera sp. Q1T1-3]|uniref:lipoprotein insertase outer membrane protein LolB n=1 Tax=Salinisphaera sp. Q1T1-3 TaxID=2321229 RepID=UPI000E7128B1|nr:lipoprotein insertase outer membrane protein LolB [Salinisphaera sp. Q1T1-3]RJS94433.1 outer membrane lipoprotein LolB [Salinisphaera sp. Q1T1-3]